MTDDHTADREENGLDEVENALHATKMYAAALEKDNSKLRLMLWLRHDAQHNSVLYGDDGEMQCAACGIDFKRYTPREIEQAFTRIGMERLAIAQKEPQPARAVIVHVVERDAIGHRMWLMERKPPFPFYGMWATPGGSIEPGETALAAAQRETQEEMGLEVLSSRFVPFGAPSHHVMSEKKVVLEYFLLELRAGEVPKCTEPEKHSEWQRFPAAAPPAPVTPGTEIVIGRFLTWVRP